MHELRGRAVFRPLGAAVGVSLGVTVVLITVFNHLIAPMRADLGFDTPVLSLALSIHLAMLILALPLAGAIADHIGARQTAIVSALLYGLCLLWISLISASKTELYAAFALAALLGAGASPVTYTRAIVSRFEKARGMALGLTLSGVGFASILLPIFVSVVIAEAGWRMAVASLGLLAIAAGVIGGIAVGNGPIGSSFQREESKGDRLSDAVRTVAFWKIAGAFVLFGVSLAGVVAHLSDVWSGLGITSISVPGFQALIGVGTIIGRIAGGAMMDRWAAHGVGALFGLCGSSALALLVAGHEAAPAVYVAGLALGLCLGAESDIASYLVSRYYGVAHFARIYAVQASAFMTGLALGPILFAMASKQWGYPSLLLSASAGVLASASVLLSLRPPAMTSAETRAA